MSRAIRRTALQRAARDYCWLYDVRHGLTVAVIAINEGVSPGRVKAGVARARTADKARPVLPPLAPGPHLVLLFPCVGFGPTSGCPHFGPIPRDSHLCCAVCHSSGLDHLGILQRSPSTDPPRDKKPAPPKPRIPGQPLTRKQRRAKMFAGLKAEAA